MKRLLSYGCVLLVSLLPALALAWDLNKDLYNTTGQVANDIEIVLDGAVVVTDHYDGDDGMQFPGFSTYIETMNGAPRTVLHWSGLTVMPNGKVHVGYTAGGARCIGMYWTYNGQPIGPVRQVDIQPLQGGLAIQVTNDLSYSLWPITWPFIPPPYTIDRLWVYYFATALPLGSLNNATLPAWTPLGVNVVVPVGSPVMIGSGASLTFADPNPVAGAVSAVWVMEVNTSPGGVGASTDFVQYDIQNAVPARDETWGGVKNLYK